MTVPNPEHLLEQAERLAIPPTSGRPRQVDLRRAVSAAYYAVFHFVATAAANEVVRAADRATKRYALVYRSLDHRRLREICEEARKQTLPLRYAEFAPPGGFGRNIQAFSIATIDLQKGRHAADY